MSGTPAQGIIYSSRQGFTPRNKTQTSAAPAQVLPVLGRSLTRQELLLFPCKASAPGPLLTSGFLPVPGLGMPTYSHSCNCELIFAQRLWKGLGLLPSAPGSVFCELGRMLAGPHWLGSFALQPGCWTIQLLCGLNFTFCGAGTIS